MNKKYKVIKQILTLEEWFEYFRCGETILIQEVDGEIVPSNYMQCNSFDLSQISVIIMGIKEGEYFVGEEIKKPLKIVTTGRKSNSTANWTLILDDRITCLSHNVNYKIIIEEIEDEQK